MKNLVELNREEISYVGGGSSTAASSQLVPYGDNSLGTKLLNFASTVCNCLGIDRDTVSTITTVVGTTIALASLCHDICMDIMTAIRPQKRWYEFWR